MNRLTYDAMRCLEIVQSFQGRRVLILGDVMLDRYWWGIVHRISPEAPVPVIHKKQHTLALGGAANVASNIASLGGAAVLVGVTGEDVAAQELRSALIARGLSADHLVSDGQRVTTVKTRIIAHHQQVARVDEEDTRPISVSLVRQLKDRLFDLMPSCDIVILSDYAKGLLVPELLQEAIQRAAQSGYRVVIDPKGSDYRRYHGASLITPNRTEALIAAGYLPTDTGRTAEAAGRLLDTLRVEAILVTEGEAGMTLYERSQAPRHAPALAREVFDVTGAGDTVVATIGLSLAAGADLWVAAQLANVAAGVAVGQIGTTAVTSSELCQALKERHPAPHISTKLKK
jgi:D-beta-D-heptose 7-phosphate kinase/D-beta-D-heptose 1-phosphate adenosyltransferase